MDFSGIQYVESALSRVPLVTLKGLTLRQIGAKVILSTDPQEKAAYTISAYHQFFLDGENRLTRISDLGSFINICEGERPAIPGLNLVHASRMPNIGKGGSLRSQAMMLHGLVHVELAAVDISWDLIIRDWGDATNAALPVQFYLDWLEVAYEECKHYLVLRHRLHELTDDKGDKFDYGTFPCHDGIWNDALRTSSQLLDRLALEHCTHEARGIDVCSLLTIPRFRKGGDALSADLLEQIVLVDEIDHVRKGLRYFKLIANLEADVEEADVASTFRSVLERVQGYCHSKGPFNHDLRAQAGFTRLYYEAPSLPMVVSESGTASVFEAASPADDLELVHPKHASSPLPRIPLMLLIVLFFIASAMGLTPAQHLERDMWTLVDSMVAAYPDIRPSSADQAAIAGLLYSISHFYPSSQGEASRLQRQLASLFNSPEAVAARTAGRAALRDHICSAKKAVLALSDESSCANYFIPLPEDAMSVRPLQKGTCDLGEVNEWLQGESSLRSGSITLMLFVSQSCEVCHEVIPKIDRLYRQYRTQGLNVIGIHSGVKGYKSSPAERRGIAEFFLDAKISFPLVDMTFKRGTQPYDDQGYPDWKAAARVPVKKDSIYRELFGDLEFATPLAFIIKNCQPLMEHPLDSYQILGLDVSIARAAEASDLMWPADVKEGYEDNFEAVDEPDQEPEPEEEDLEEKETSRVRARRRHRSADDNDL